MEHHLKIWPNEFWAIREEDKTFEVRFEDDRHFEVDDWLILEEWDPETKLYTGRKDEVVVTYILRGPAFGLPERMVVMSIKRKFFGLSHLIYLDDKSAMSYEDLAEVVRQEGPVIRQRQIVDDETGIFGL